MKDYSTSFEEYERFILNYIIKGDVIKINLASGEIYVIPYTRKNEKKIIEKMKNQVLNSDKFLEKEEKRYSASCKWLKLDSIFLGLNIIALILGLPEQIITDIVSLCSLILSLGLITNLYVFNTSKNNIRDVEKNRLIVENEDKINENIKVNENVLYKTTFETKDLVESAPKDEPAITINNADNIPYKDIKRIVDNIDKAENLDFDYYGNTEEKPLTLAKRYS